MTHAYLSNSIYILLTYVCVYTIGRRVLPNLPKTYRSNRFKNRWMKCIRRAYNVVCWQEKTQKVMDIVINWSISIINGAKTVSQHG